MFTAKYFAKQEKSSYKKEDENTDWVFVRFVRKKDGTIIRPKNGKFLRFPRSK